MTTTIGHNRPPIVTAEELAAATTFTKLRIFYPDSPMILILSIVSPNSKKNFWKR